MNSYKKAVLKLGTILFLVFSGSVSILTAISYFVYAFGSGNENLEKVLLCPLFYISQPAIMLRRWFFEISGAELDYHYYLAVGIFDIVGLIIFYFSICLALSWLWMWLTSKKSNLSSSDR